MTFSEKVESILEILNIDRKSVTLYQKNDLERVVDLSEYEAYDIRNDAYEDGYNDGKDEGHDGGYDEGYQDAEEKYKYLRNETLKETADESVKFLKDRGLLNTDNVDEIYDILYEHFGIEKGVNYNTLW